MEKEKELPEYNAIYELAEKYSKNLKAKIQKRMEEMEEDDNSHYLIYRVLGITTIEGDLIDKYQNKGRFLYKYAGSFLEEAAITCIQLKYPNCEIKKKIPNSNKQGRPKTFEIDCLSGNLAHEIKWRDATTDGDHITKEHTRVMEISKVGYTPVRVMFYYPNRDQAKRIQATLSTIYNGVNGKYYYGDNAWEYIKTYTNIDLLSILEKIAKSKEKECQ